MAGSTLSVTASLPSAHERPRLAWRYLANRGFAPLAAPDPVAFALTLLAAEAVIEQQSAWRDFKFACGLLLAASAVLSLWLVIGNATILVQLSFRATAGWIVIYVGNAAVEAFHHWSWARGVIRAVHTGRADEALTHALNPKGGAAAFDSNQNANGRC